MKFIRIKKIKDHRCFRDFVWPEKLHDFGRFNIIYGWNWSGKTILSNIFRLFEKKESLKDGILEVKVDDNIIHGANIENEIGLPQVRVFNRDFVNENVFKSFGSVNPIFYLGKKSVDIQKKISELQKEVESKKELLSNKLQIKSSNNKKLDEFYIHQAKLIRSMLRSSGSNQYNNYNKTDFKNKCEVFQRNKDYKKKILDEQKKDELKKQKESLPKPKINLLDYTFPSFDAQIQDINILLKQTVISQSLKELINEEELTNWVSQGLEIHQGKESEVCLFCGQKIPKERMKQLENHFNDQYIHFIENIDQKISSIDNKVNLIKKINFPHKSELYDHLTKRYNSCLKELKEQLTTTQEFLIQLKKELKNKKVKLFQSITLKIKKPNIKPIKLNELNDILKEHNEETNEFQDRIKEARKQLEETIVAESLENYINKKVAVEIANKEYDDVKHDIKEINKNIKKSERKIIEYQKPVDELNDEICSYLGHNEIKFRVKDKGYEITRSDEIAEKLSEGEKTAIAFLYFLKSLKDKDFDLSKGVVVIDDPISSLDANALFHAFAFMKERTKGVGQVFILTHNFAFFRQIRNWFHHLRGQRKRRIEDRPARFYMLSCKLTEKGRCSKLSKLDPLLERYNSEYHYLFSLIYNESKVAKSRLGIESYYHLPNIARRLLESFLSFRKPKESGELKKQLDKINYDPVKKTRIIRFLHTHSHRGQVDDPEHDISILSETPEVLSDIIDLIKTEDERHFNEMKTLISIE